jgi:hypothetical protein
MKIENLKKGNEIKMSIHNLQCLINAITKKKGNNFAYLKEIYSDGFSGWKIEDKELTKELKKFIVSFCKNKINKLQKKLDKL